MSVRLALAELYVPPPLRRRGLDELAEAAAMAFGCRPPQWRRRRHADRLEQFARFTATHVMVADQAGCTAVRAALRDHAEQLGERLRRRLGVCSHEEALRALKVLYRQIGIELDATSESTIDVSSCIFSRFYDPRMCQILSAMDEGIVRGLTGGGELRFERRITEGARSCRASLGETEVCARS